MNRASLIGLAVAFFTLLLIFLQTKPTGSSAEKMAPALERQLFSATYGTPLLNGVSDDDVWQSAEWLPLDQVWMGSTPTATDFSGKYKIAWDENNLYVLAEITDDTLIGKQQNGLLKYWDEDCLEIFVDEDASGGNHPYSYNVFAYHIALDGNVIDIRPDSAFAYFNDHCTTRRVSNGYISTWEVAVKIFDGNKYVTDGDNISKLLKAGKKMGFMVAYGDSDHSAERANFMGSVKVLAEDKDQGWIDADLFGLLELN